MRKFISVKTAFSKKFKRYRFEGVWLKVLGNVTKGGFWIIYGAEKHGKSWFALVLAQVLGQIENVVYISSEEGISGEFVEAMKRAGIDPSQNPFKLNEHITFAEIKEELLNRRQAPSVIFIDNLTTYKDEVSANDILKLFREYPDTHFVFISHEDNGEPDLAIGKMVKKLSKVIMRVEGLACFVSGRVPGGQILIDEQKAVLYHGTEVTEN